MCCFVLCGEFFVLCFVFDFVLKMNRTTGFTEIYEGSLLLNEGMYQKDGFTFEKHCVLLIDNEQICGYMFCLKTISHWNDFKQKFIGLFNANQVLCLCVCVCVFGKHD